VHASAPFEPPTDDQITWIDLDLDFEIAGDQLALLDEEEFHVHARTMKYPDEVVRGAWSGIATIAARYTNGEWPFDGSMQQWIEGR
jgi:protein associated with RNAse G/E